MTLHNSKVADLLHAIEDAKKEVSEIRSEIVWIHAQLTEQTPAQADVSLSGLDAAGRSTASSEAASSASQDSSGMSQEPFGLDSPADVVAQNSPPLFNASEQADAASGSDAPAADPNALAQDPIAAAAPGGRETEPTLPAPADSDPAKQLAESKQRVESVIGFLRLDNAATDATPRMIQEIFERLRPPGSPHAEQVVLALALVGKITRPNDMQKTRLTPETAALAETSRHRLQLKSQIEQLQVERETKIQDLGAKHPEIQKIDRLLEQYNKSMAEMDATNGFGENTEEQRPYSNEQFIGAYVNTLALSYNNMMTQLPDLVNEFEAHYRRAHRLNEISRQIRDADDEVQMFRQFQEETIATLAQINPRYIDQNFVNNEDEGFKFTELDAPSTGSRVWPNLPLVLGLGGLIGSLFGMCLGYFVDVADKTFHNPDEIMRQLSMPLIGHIPVIPQSKRHVIENSYIDPSICTFHRPKSQASEAFRAIRTALFFSTKGKTNSVIQVTSPTPGDGKSTIAANVAVSIAQSGKRVLLLDSDMRRPTVHHAFGIKTREGFPQVLNGEKTWRSMVYQCEEVPGLSILPCGDKPGNPAELISTPRVGELLEEMRHHYDFIILDTPPVLAVTDPCPVAARVDGVILTIRIKKNVKISSDRATEILHSVGANLIGVVVNGVGTQSGYGSQYSYGAYRAGYQYNGYGYGYGYSYGYGRQSDDEKPVRPSPVRNLNAPESSGAQVN
jgi:capsular exopolysaccharide synthesis family protein